MCSFQSTTKDPNDARPAHKKGVPVSCRIGIDVGGTNTDAVLMRGTEVVAKIKTPTTDDVTSGITTALNHVLGVSQTPTSDIAGVMIGTTHFTNAVVERKRLQPTA
ncbi:MAG: hypothetical protein IT339_02470, partial [Thermomicrobiales bacterium]|nr:hypothetical protein [Thermomicrobiales bacterium]